MVGAKAGGSHTCTATSLPNPLHTPEPALIGAGCACGGASGVVWCGAVGRCSCGGAVVVVHCNN